MKKIISLLEKNGFKARGWESKAERKSMGIGLWKSVNNSGFYCHENGLRMLLFEKTEKTSSRGVLIYKVNHHFLTITESVVRFKKSTVDIDLTNQEFSLIARLIQKINL